MATSHAFEGRDPVPAPDPTFFDDTVTDKYGWDHNAEVRVWPLDAEGALVGAAQRYEFCARAGGAAVALARASDGGVDWSRPEPPAVEEVVGPNGFNFVAGDDTLAFGSGVRDLDMVGPFELVVSDGAGGGFIELQLPLKQSTEEEGQCNCSLASHWSICIPMEWYKLLLVSNTDSLMKYLLGITEERQQSREEIFATRTIGRTTDRRRWQPEEVGLGSVHLGQPHWSGASSGFP